MARLDQTIERLGRNQVVAIRQSMANELKQVARSLMDLLETWEENNLPGDFLSEREFPFGASLEDLIANVSHAVEEIEFNNDFIGMKPVTFTVSREEFERLLDEIDQPARVVPRLKEMLEGRTVVE